MMSLIRLGAPERAVVLLLGFSLLSGCIQQPARGVITAPARPTTNAPQQEQNTGVAVYAVPDIAPLETAPPAPSSNGAVTSLITQARSLYDQQDYQSAIATAERGLRIDRRSADLYLVLAQSYLQLALPQKAQMFVQQGLRYAPQGSETANSLARTQALLGN
jgi:tetratricopeptide (TPR) repeat protein